MNTFTKGLVLIVAISSFWACSSNAQQCGLPEWQLTFSRDAPAVCPVGGPNTVPYILIGVSKTRVYHMDCVSGSNVQPPPPPNTVCWAYNETTGETGYGQRYCNYSSAYSTYECDPIMSMSFTQASSPSDYNRFYNRATSFTAVNGTCPQTNFDQDFQQCPGLACAAPPPPPPPPPPCFIGCPCITGCITPIILDTDGNGFTLTSAANGVTFDIAGNGKPIKMAWTGPGSTNAFLC